MILDDFTMHFCDIFNEDERCRYIELIEKTSTLFRYQYTIEYIQCVLNQYYPINSNVKTLKENIDSYYDDCCNTSLDLVNMYTDCIYNTIASIQQYRVYEEYMNSKDIRVFNPYLYNEVAHLYCKIHAYNIIKQYMYIMDCIPEIWEVWEDR